MAHQQADLIWADGQGPMSVQFDDPYFSRQDGLAETRHVFVAGNGLTARFRDGFHVAELGFGTGLNMLATWAEWEKCGQTSPLRFTSFEAFPMALSDMKRALQAFPELAEWRGRFLNAWKGGQCDLGTLQLTVIVGDARETVQAWQGHADAWYLDGFSPAKNPEMWGSDLMAEVANHTGPGGTVATYTAAGFVRRGLEQAGFNISRTAGFGRKRHMTQGVLA